MPLVVTAYVWGRTTVLRASSVAHLSRQLYLLCPYWTHQSADELAHQLARGLVVLELDSEAVFLPGDFQAATLDAIHDDLWSYDGPPMAGAA